MVDDSSDRQLLSRLAQDLLDEKRRSRRWSIFFRLLSFGFVFVLLVVFLAPGEKVCVDKCTAVVDLEGVLDHGGQASAENVIAGLQAAFEHSGTRGVVLRINSPGGSPVQAGQIYDEMRRLRIKFPDTPLYAVVEEIAASGGYYVAAAADRIYVDRASLVGSIGVIIESFGFPAAMEKLGVERRVLTAGRNKNFLDPFSPLPEAQREQAQVMLDDIHRQFITAVKNGRGARLKETPDMFTGLVWNGDRSIELGLTDATGTVASVARDVIKAPELVDFTQQENIAERFARRFGATAGREVWRLMGSGGPQLR